MAAPSVVPSIIRSLILLGLVVLLLYFVGKWVLWLFGGGNETLRSSVLLQVEERSTVNVSLEGGLMQRAEDSLKLYPGDRVATGGNGHAMLSFFDGSNMRMDVQSDLTIDESTKGSAESEMEITLAKGALWVRTPDVETFSGSIVRSIALPRYTVTLPSDTEVIIEENGVLVFSADGQGVTLALEGDDATYYIGEGQQMRLPSGDVVGDPLRYRSAIEPLAVQRSFIEESRGMQVVTTNSGGTLIPSEDDILTVSSPADKQSVTANTVRVEGSVNIRVERVRVNGYDATINREQGSFSQELSLKENQDTRITIEALDARGIVLSQVVRTVHRGSEELPSPAITSPASAGATYRTQKTEFAITGTAPAGAAGIMVNEYKLQLFRAGDRTWSYLASTALSNMKAGANVYDVYTLDAAGNKSAPARITILLEAGAEGIVSGGSATSAASATSQAAVIDETTLPNNAPLMAGTIRVTGPTAGTSHTATGSEFLLEGTTPGETASVWVNGYRLQLYKAGSTFWNYIAKAEYNTLKPGRNVYKIVARNQKNEILDTFEYTATYNP